MHTLVEGGGLLAHTLSIMARAGKPQRRSIRLATLVWQSCWLIIINTAQCAWLCMWMSACMHWPQMTRTLLTPKCKERNLHAVESIHSINKTLAASRHASVLAQMAWGAIASTCTG